MSKNSHILVIDRAIPTPDWSGASARLLNIINSMRKLGFNIDLVVRDPHEMNRISKIFTPLGIHNIYNIRGNSPKFDELVRNASLAWLSFFDIAEEYLPVIRKISTMPIVIDTVDVHSLRLFRNASVKMDNEIRIYANEIKNREAKIYAAADALIGVTEPDCVELGRLAPGIPVHLISNIYKRYAPGNDKHENRQGILFIGNATHPPNRDAIELLYKEIFPRISSLHPGIKLTVIGFGTDSLPFKPPSNTIVLGRVKNVLPMIRKAMCSVAPLRFGAGIKGKVVESMFYGTPVVATEVAVEGMNVKHQREIMIASNWEEFIDHVWRLHCDYSLWQSIRREGILETRTIYGEVMSRKAIYEVLSSLGL